MTTKSPAEDESFLARLERSGVGQQLAQEEAAARLNRRRELAAERERLTSELAAQLPPLLEGVAKALKASEDAWAEWQAARVRHGAAVLDQMALTHSFEHPCAQIEAELRATASPLIDTFAETLRHLIAVVGSPLQDNPEMRGGMPSPEAVEGIRATVQERDAHLARLNAMLPVIEDLKLAPLSEPELMVKLDGLRKLLDEEGK